MTAGLAFGGLASGGSGNGSRTSEPVAALEAGGAGFEVTLGADAGAAGTREASATAVARAPTQVPTPMKRDLLRGAFMYSVDYLGLLSCARPGCAAFVLGRSVP